MLKDQCILCISSIDWDFLWQQHQEIMSTFARHGNRVLFIENTGVRSPRLSDIPRIWQRLKNWRKSLWGFRTQSDGLYIYSPLVLPFPYSRIARLINRWIVVCSIRWWMRNMRFPNPIIWTFLPTQLTLDIAKEIDHRMLVYYATDNFAATSRQAAKITRVEPDVIRESNLVFVNARNRREYCEAYTKHLVQIPMGVCADKFEEAKKDSLEIPADIPRDKGPVIGYIGGVRQSIDQNLVARLAERFRECALVFVGPLQTEIEALRRYANVFFLGPKPHAEMPRYVNAFRIGIVPYVKDGYTDSVSAAKLHEYLIMGKPVVATNIAEIAAYAKTIPSGSVHVADSPEAFFADVEKALSENGRFHDQSVELARERSWSRIIEQMSDAMEARLREMEAVPTAWHDQLLAAYRRMKRKLVSTATAVLAGVWLIFYSPLVWGVGAPLKIEQTPRPVDAILVFAGGVGESGRPGQGYEERVQYAADLYRRGLAPHLIFSSGYAYTMKEAEVMRALALSLGIPESAITLETAAINTYQNVTHCAVILREHRWKSALVVSSPYHMRRVDAVWHKHAPDLQAIYTPVPKSHYFETSGRVQLQHWQAILHEWLGLAYYKWKGWA